MIKVYKLSNNIDKLLVKSDNISFTKKLWIDIIQIQILIHPFFPQTIRSKQNIEQEVRSC